MNGIHSITIPQLNVNDDTVTFVEWSVPHGTVVDTQTPVSVVETSKAANELCAEHSGVLYHLVTPVRKVKVGEEIGVVGPSLPEIEIFLSERAAAQAVRQQAVVQAPAITSKARRLMDEYGVTEADMADAGILGAIKEKDVLAYLGAKDAYRKNISSHPISSSLPPGIQALVDDQGPLPDHEAAVADVLTASCQSLLLTTAELEVDCSSINAVLARARDEGRMLTFQHCIIACAGRALKKFPRLKSVYHGRSVYCYHDCAIGFVVKSLAGDLYTPVIRSCDEAGLADIARQSHALTMKINRGAVQQEDLTGGCFTVSHIASPVLRSFRALPNRFQSAVLAVAGERSILRLINGICAEVPVCTLTLSYDHALCDGMYAAEFLHALVSELKTLTYE
jgi:pyruvate/2-oxoglutarate dehydrogenase complex dihydrolipoamide acyltransferase (E2) component